MAEKVYLPYLKWAVKKSKISGTLKTPGNFCMKRGDFIIAHAEKNKILMEGKFINIFDINLSVVDKIDLKPGESGLFKVISEKLNGSKTPVVLHSTLRLVSQKYEKNQLIFTVKGPAGTPAIARIFFPRRKKINITAVNSNNEKVEVSVKKDAATYLLKFPNSPKGVTVMVRLTTKKL